jgi:uncharacterized protein (DUF983 family)
MGGMQNSASDTEHRPFMTGLMRGLKHRCPNCGEGKLYKGYLKVEPTCAACGHDLSAYRADDGPAYFTILIVGHLIIAPLLLFPIIWEASPWIVVPVSLTTLTVIVLAMLPRIKGGFIGGLWSIRPAPAHG